jgi:hypothetical protein
MSNVVVQESPKFSMIPHWVIEGHSPLGIAVYVCLAKFASCEGRCFPSMSTLAKTLRVSVNSVRKGIAELEDAGTILVERSMKDDGTHAVNIYNLRFHEVAQDLQGGSANFGVPQDLHKGGSANFEGGVVQTLHHNYNQLNYNQENNNLSCFVAEFRAAYPKRYGDQGWKRAEAKLAKIAEADRDAVLTGVRNYAHHCNTAGLTGTEMIKMAATFVTQETWREYQTPMVKLTPASTKRYTSAMEGVNNLRLAASALNGRGAK